MNNITKNKKKAGLGLALTAAVTGTLFAAPQAQAYGGSEDPTTGIVWGTKDDGTYKIPLASGGEIDGFCIDPGKAYPKQNGSTNYGEPVPYGSGLDANAKKSMIVSLMLGQAATQNAAMIDQFKSTISPFVPQANNWTVDDVVAGASGVIHYVGDMNTAEGGSNGEKWNETSISQLSPESKQVYDAIFRFAPLIPDNLLNASGVQLFVRAPETGDKQRMIAMSDIQLPKFDFKIPDFEMPSVPSSESPSSPTTSGTTPATSVTTSSEKTTSEKTTSRVSSKTTENKEKTPSIRTSAGTKEGNVVEAGKNITDTVTYDNLKPDTKYKLVAETAAKDTGALLGNKGELEFTPESSRGSVDVQIPIQNADSSELVVFETLYELTNNGEKKVAEHRDINDQAQTVGKPSYTPEIRTLASSSTDNIIQSGTTVNDQVSYSGLEPGKEYRLEARLMDKVTGSDTGASQVMTFTPEATAGTVTVENIAVTNPDSTEQVVFERLYDNSTNELVASHEDITDAAQTVGAPAEQVRAEKGKKKVAPKVAPEEKPAPVMQQKQESNNAPIANAAPGGMGGGSAPAPRPVIASVPSGGSDGYGSSIFNR